MTLSLTPDARREATASLRRYLQENLVEEVGDLATQQLLDFILEELGPTLHNQAVADVVARLQVRIADVESELAEDEFPYWPAQARRKGRRS